VGGGTPLAAIASASGATVALVKELNSHLLRGATPPGEAMWVRVPSGSAAAFGARFAALDSAARRAFTRVETKKGESMASIARKRGLTIKHLAWYNPKMQRLKSGNLVAGQRLLVPSKATVAAALDVPNPSIEKFPRRAKASVRRSTGRKATAKGSSAKKAPAKGSAAKKAPVKGSAAKKAPAKGSAAKKASVKGSAAKKAPAKGSAAKKKPATAATSKQPELK